VKAKNPKAPAVTREADEDWDRQRAMREALILAVAIFLLAMITAAVVVHFVVP
jgi:hypothetical protein